MTFEAGVSILVSFACCPEMPVSHDYGSAVQCVKPLHSFDQPTWKTGF